MIDGAGDGQQIYHYHNDPNGCPTRLTDAAGEVKWAASYTAWGGVSKLHVNQVENLIRLQGQYEDGETGLSYNRFRYYDSIIANFLAQDPLGLLPSENPYRFAPNIFGWCDPFGLSCGSARRSAVRKAWKAWKEEQALVRKKGVGTRAWTKAEKKRIISYR